MSHIIAVEGGHYILCSKEDRVCLLRGPETFDCSVACERSHVGLHGFHCYDLHPIHCHIHVLLVRFALAHLKI